MQNEKIIGLTNELIEALEEELEVKAELIDQLVDSLPECEAPEAENPDEWDEEGVVFKFTPAGTVFKVTPAGFGDVFRVVDKMRVEIEAVRVSMAQKDALIKELIDERDQWEEKATDYERLLARYGHTIDGSTNLD